MKTKSGSETGDRSTGAGWIREPSIRNLMILAGIFAAAAVLIPGGAGHAYAQAPLSTQLAPPTGGADASSQPMILRAARPWRLPFLWYLTPICAVMGLWTARRYYREVLASDEGDPAMIRIAGYVRDGAKAYLFRQYKVVGIAFILVAVLLGWMAFGLQTQHPIVPFAFISGGVLSCLSGWFGMKTATAAAHRTAAGARKSLNAGLRVAFRAGAVTGLVVVGFALLDICAWFAVLYYFTDLSLHLISVIMLTRSMGASLQALFARVGGGIFTKAADVGADLVGKVEAGIPEDDARNPATIADNVGDNVGDVAGMGADLYESYMGAILATCALGVAAAVSLNPSTSVLDGIRLIVLPMVIAGAGIVSSIWLGIERVKTDEGASVGSLMAALNKGLLASSGAIVVATFIACFWLLHDVQGVVWYGVASAVVVGLVAGWGIGQFTERYTSYDFAPTQSIAQQGQTGPATLLICGVATGMKSAWAAITIVILAILLSFAFAGGRTDYALGLYGVGLAAVGMLATLGYTLATDAYGPIADNAGGNAQMTHQSAEVRERTDMLDSLGNTTAATGKGFAIGSAALTALALLAAYLEEVRVGHIREAQTWLVQHNIAATAPAGAIGPDAYYIGHGKIALRAAAGEDESAFESFMVMDAASRSWLEARSLRSGMEGSKVGVPRLSQGAAAQDSQIVTIDDAQQQRKIEVVSVRTAKLQRFIEFYDVTLINPRVLCGMFAGVALVFVFCAMTIQAVGRAAHQMMGECRAQFQRMREYLTSVMGLSAADAVDPKNWPIEPVQFGGGWIPDYARCVDISTRSAQKEMIAPSCLAIVAPLAIGLLLGVPGVMGMLAGALTNGFALAIFMANAGGAWDNAKKYIEKGNYGGKGSFAHKAAVIGDTVGDPFKDTSGPSLNILIKLLSIVSIIFAGLVVRFAPQVAAVVGL